MNYEKALHILELKKEGINQQVIKKQYYKLALKCHPDKNIKKNINAHNFEQLNEAYVYLQKNINKNIKNKTMENTTTSPPFNYEELLTIFVQLICRPKWVILLCKILKTQSIQYLNNARISKQTLLYLYNILSSYRTTFHLTEVFLQELRELLLQKQSQVYLLNPSVTDLLNNNLYKLYVNDELYLVPLWHHKLYFTDTLIVICEPEFSLSEKQQNIQIDEDNNLYIDLYINCKELLTLFENGIKNNNNNNNKELTYPFVIGNKTFTIPLSVFKLTTKPQIYRIIGEGIRKPTPVESNMEQMQENIHNKSDIIVKISLF